MIVARFPGAPALLAAAAALRASGLAVETRTPIALPPDEHAPSRIPCIIFAAAVLAFLGAFGMQCYANILSYPQLIGGRPAFFWTSYLVYSVEAGVLAAISTGLLCFLVSNGLPRYWEPADESDALRAASLDGWFLVADEAARPLLARHGATEIEAVPA